MHGLAARMSPSVQVKPFGMVFLNDVRFSEEQSGELLVGPGTYRLREELIARANVAASPTRVIDVLFTQMLIQ